MQFRDGATVFAFDGRELGELDRVVIDPETQEVTAIIVRKGLLFTEDKVVPISLIAEATDERVALYESAGDLERLPLFEEAHYVPVPGDELPPGQLYWYPPYPASSTTWWGFPNYVGYPPYPMETERNIPEGQIALKEGARVISSDGEYVADVKQIMTDELADRVTHLLIVRGGLLSYEHKLIPFTWVRHIDEDEVHLRVTAQCLHNLPEYAATS